MAEDSALMWVVYLGVQQAVQMAASTETMQAEWSAALMVLDSVSMLAGALAGLKV